MANRIVALLVAGTGVLPEWLADETLYGLLSRYHVLSGNLRPSVTTLALVGHDRCKLPDLAKNLGAA